MARKSYTEKEREQIRESLIETALQIMTEFEIKHININKICQKVGISKTFFYSFFPTREDLILNALYHQQPMLIKHAQKLRSNSELTRRQCLEQFLRDCCYGLNRNIIVMTIEEEQAIFRRLSYESYLSFQEKQLQIFSQLLTAFGFSPTEVDPKLFGNLVLSMIVVRRSMPDGIPFLFPDMADKMVDYQISVLVDSLEKIQKSSKNKAN